MRVMTNIAVTWVREMVDGTACVHGIVDGHDDVFVGGATVEQARAALLDVLADRGLGAVRLLEVFETRDSMPSA